MRRLILFAAALSLVGCATSRTGIPPASAVSTTPDKADAVFAIAGTAASVADAIGAAPPATLTRTTIDDKAIRVAFQAFDATLTIVDRLVAGNVIVKGSPTALGVKRALLVAQDALNAASAAQRAGSASTYSAALRNAETALADARAALVR